MIALVTVLTDHIGGIFYPDMIALRVIGRIAFPIYCFLLVQGFLHTSNLKKYMIRMGVFALLSEVPFDLARTGYWLDLGRQNVFITLFLGLCCMTIYRLSEQTQQPILMVSGILAVCILSQLIRADYQWLGILLIMIFYIWKTSKLICYAAFITVTSVYCLTVMSWLQAASICALIPIYWYNGKRGKYSFRYVFYFFYPVHLFILYFVSFYCK